MSCSIPVRKTGRMSQIEGDFPMDEAIIAALPDGTTVISARPYGYSAWNQTGKIVTAGADGNRRVYFLKLALHDHGRQLLMGEYTAISTVNSLVSGLVPVPVAWGTYKSSPPQVHFFIEEFRDMDMSLPKPAALAKRVFQLHSLKSPNGKFGFPVTTFDGIAPHVNEWEENWTVFFTRLLCRSIEVNQEANKNTKWPGFDIAAERVLRDVIPKLLDHVKENGGPIVPRLIHGDLWGGNIGQDKETGEIIFFDAGSFYAHNELDVAMWRRYGVHNLGQPYLVEYQRYFAPAEPQREFDDRSRLYSLKFDLNHSSGQPGDNARDVAFNNMVYLCQRYSSAKDLPDYDPNKDPSSGSAYIYAE